MSSIRVRLLKWLVGPIVVVNLAGAALTYLLAWAPAQVAFDQALLDAAAMLAAQVQGGDPDAPLQMPRADLVDATWFSVRDSEGHLLAGDAVVPLVARDGAAHDATIGGEPVRAVALTTETANGQTVQIGVARTMRKLHRIRSATLRSLALIELALSLGLIGLLWLSVTNGLLPLSRTRANLAARDGEDLTPVQLDDVPHELVPVVGAFNELLDKVQAGAQARHDFLADMAHQLRTPLAGMLVQLEWLAARHAGDPETAGSLNLMRVANERMIRQTNQLLALARATPGGVAQARLETVDLAQLVQESVQYFVGEADKKGQDLGFDLERALVAGNPFLLRDLIDNLIDNALRYTPAGGTVTVRCGSGGEGAWLIVEDSGPGIPLEKRALVFNRFVRLDDKVPGSGLGLAVVRDIALAHRARIELSDMPQGRGLRFAVRFPLPIVNK
ncbi:sensor histidine kinase [Massilia horti]|uniref:histidine kinase n=1 Tax=Massilia horti TaxID=2562153 RepID=A0A4Y9T1E6_9BURK|nr:sensor histidine kinase [Massilia horti]TFW33142.1 sensor histidine kinase [Massilia horti]